MTGEIFGNILIGLYLFMSILCFIIFIYIDRDNIKEYGMYPIKDIATLIVCALVWPVIMITAIVIYHMDKKNEIENDDDDMGDESNE